MGNRREASILPIIGSDDRGYLLIEVKSNVCCTEYLDCVLQIGS